jgi:hypothetical protein
VIGERRGWDRGCAAIAWNYHDSALNVTVMLLASVFENGMERSARRVSYLRGPKIGLGVPKLGLVVSMEIIGIYYIGDCAFIIVEKPSTCDAS